MTTASLPRAGLLPLIAAAVLAGATACAHRAVAPPPDPGNPRPDSCPGFTVVAKTFMVTSADTTIPIGVGHSLEFRAGAVTGPTEFRVQIGPNHANATRQWGEIDIKRTDGSLIAFGADVFLELSYRGCTPAVKADPNLVIRKTGPYEQPMGGRKDPHRQVVRALIPGLSTFAIAR